MFTSSVKAQEASGPKGPLGLFGKSYGLVITVVIDDSHPLEKEMRIINEHYIKWLNRRGKNCEDLILGFTAPRTPTRRFWTNVANFSCRMWETKRHWPR